MRCHQSVLANQLLPAFAQCSWIRLFSQSLSALLPASKNFVSLRFPPFEITPNAPEKILRLELLTRALTLVVVSGSVTTTCEKAFSGNRSSARLGHGVWLSTNPHSFSLPSEIEDGNAALAACGWERGVGRPRSISVIQRPISPHVPRIEAVSSSKHSGSRICR